MQVYSLCCPVFVPQMTGVPDPDEEDMLKVSRAQSPKLPPSVNMPNAVASAPGVAVTGAAISKV